MSDYRKQEDVYNLDGKEEFIDSIDMSQYPPRWWERLFEKSGLLESKLDKDIYNFTTPEILTFYKYLDLNSFESLMIINTNLVKYGNWALNNNLIVDGQNHFLQISNEVLRDCVNETGINKSVISEEQLQKLMGQVNNPLDKFVIYCIWEGIKGKEYSEILELKMSDINTSTREVTLCTGRVIKVSERFIAIAKETDSEVDYLSYGEHPKITPLQPSEYIYKLKHNSKGIYKGRSVYRLITILADDAKISDYVSVNSLFQSGFIYHLNKVAEKNNMSAEEVLNNEEIRKEVVHKYNFNMQVKQRFLLKYRNFLV